MLLGVGFFLRAKGAEFSIHEPLMFFEGLVLCIMVFSATFNNIAVISWRSVLLVEEALENPRQYIYKHDVVYVEISTKQYLQLKT